MWDFGDLDCWMLMVPQHTNLKMIGVLIILRCVCWGFRLGRPPGWTPPPPRRIFLQRARDEWRRAQKI